MNLLNSLSSSAPSQLVPDVGPDPDTIGTALDPIIAVFYNYWHWVTEGKRTAELGTDSDIIQAIGGAPDALRMQRVVSFYEKLPRGAAPEVKAKGLLGRYQAKHFGKNPTAARMLLSVSYLLCHEYADTLATSYHPRSGIFRRCRLRTKLLLPSPYVLSRSAWETSLARTMLTLLQATTRTTLTKRESEYSQWFQGKRCRLL